MSGNVGATEVGEGGLPLGTRRTRISRRLWKRWLPLVLKGLPRLQVDLRFRRAHTVGPEKASSPDQQKE